MTIESETFYRAFCDASGCERVFPDDDDEGASHYPLTDLRTGLAEPRGEYDETWTVTGNDDTYCPRHAPGNIDCTSCGGHGWPLNPHSDGVMDRYIECDRCGGRGYLVPNPTSLGSSDG